MQGRTVLIGLAALSALLAPVSARAEIFTDISTIREPVAAGPEAPPKEEKRPKRLLISGQFAQWDHVPFTRPVIAGSGARPLQDFRPDPGYLVTLDYGLSKRWSLGAWFNHVPLDVEGKVGRNNDGGGGDDDGDDDGDGEFEPTGTKGGHGGRGRQATIGDFDANLWEFHGSYYLPEKFGENLSLQLGVIFADQNVDINGLGLRNGWRAGGGNRRSNSDFRVGGNLWLNKIQRLTGGKHPISLFGGIGGQGFDGDNPHFQALLGASLGITENISLTSSFWWADIDGDSNSRITAGLSGRF
jgi:hypothetical protein